MEIRFKKLDKDAIVPKYQSDGASGMDLHSIETVVLHGRDNKDFNNWVPVKTGLAIELVYKTGMDFECQVRPRSGLAIKAGISIVNTPGTIDSDYRGEIIVTMINHSRNDFVISKGDRIAQLVVCPINKVEIKEVDILSETKRGDGGFGSTGSK